MKRHYFISDDLDDLEAVEHDLEESGVTTPQIHVLSEDDSGVENHHLNDVEAVLRKDVVHSTEIGFVVGILGAGLIIAISYFTGITETITWVPSIFLAVVILGFCTWEGGLIGIQNPHHDFKRFEEQLHQGKHVLFVDVEPEQEALLDKVVHAHPRMELAGVGAATPSFVIHFQERFARFTRWAP